MQFIHVISHSHLAATEATSQPATTSEIPEGGSAELTSVPTTVGATTVT